MRKFITKRLDVRSSNTTALVGVITQVSRPLVSLLTMPLLYRYLGGERLGIWLIGLSIMALVTTLNSGLTLSLVTSIGRTIKEKTPGSIIRIASAGSIIAIFTAILAGLVTSIIVGLVDWGSLFEVASKDLGIEVRQMMFALVAILFLGIITSVPRQIVIGKMDGSIAYIFDFLGVLLGSIALIFLLLNRAPLWLLAFGFMIPSIIIPFLGCSIYLKKNGIITFLWKWVDGSTLKILGRDSLKMLGYQGAYSISSQTDLLLIGIYLGALEATTYGIAQRIFFLPILIVSAINNAQWPVMAHADSIGDKNTVLKMLKSTLIFACGTAVAVAVLSSVFYDDLVLFWIGHTESTSLGLKVGMVLWVLVATVVNTLDSVLKARQESGLLMRSMMKMAAVNIAVTLILIPRVGISGAIFGSAIGYAVALLIPYTIKIYHDGIHDTKYGSQLE